jgi:hypothetical protein
MSKAGDLIRKLFGGFDSQTKEALNEMQKLQGIISDPNSTQQQKDSATEVFRTYLGKISPEAAANLAVLGIHPDIVQPVAGKVDSALTSQPEMKRLLNAMTSWQSLKWNIQHKTWQGITVLVGSVVILGSTVYFIVKHFRNKKYGRK